jgi:para-nitrobenzyl esterase
MRDAADPIILTVTGGRVRGDFDDGVHTFRGLPYAAPLIGANRWRAPQPTPPWEGVRAATRFGPACPQPSIADGVASGLIRWRRASRLFIDTVGNLGAPTGEASLVLNVWTPDPDPEAKLPVLVFIHGGSFAAGAGSQPIYNGRALAKAGLVVVTINYRLGLLGFMGGDDLFPDGLGVANRGFLDQVAALTWVAENIAAFGGDPECVTVSGESAGAASALAMMTTPATQGLIRRVISFSGAPLAYPHDDCSRFAKDYLAAIGVETADDLVALTDVRIFKSRPQPQAFFFRNAKRYGALGADHLGYLVAATNTELFPDPPLDFIAAGKARGVDLMIGTCRDEARLMSMTLPLPGALAARVMFNLFGGVMKPRGKPAETFKAYRALMPGAAGQAVRERAMCDALFRKPSVEMADAVAQADADARAYLYRYDWPSPALNGAYGAMHGFDIPGIFQTYAEMASLVGPEDGARPAGDALHAAVVSFVKTGTPAIPDTPDWPAYDPETKPCMVIDQTSELRHDIDGPFEALW